MAPGQTSCRNPWSRKRPWKKNPTPESPAWPMPRVLLGRATAPRMPLHQLEFADQGAPRVRTCLAHPGDSCKLQEKPPGAGHRCPLGRYLEGHSQTPPRMHSSAPRTEAFSRSFPRSPRSARDFAMGREVAGEDRETRGDRIIITAPGVPSSSRGRGRMEQARELIQSLASGKHPPTSAPG
jgi:hypothetical protein